MVNKKGLFGLSPLMLLVMVFVFFMGYGAMGSMAQELKNAACDNSTIYNLTATTLFPSLPEGSTDSFGGAGSNRFGGYDGKVTHDSFLDKVASTSLYKTNKSMLNPDCVPLDGVSLFITNNFIYIYIGIFLCFIIFSKRLFFNFGYYDEVGL